MFHDIHAVNSLAMAKILFAEHLFAHVLPKRGKYPLRLILSSVACLLFAFWFPVPSDDIATIVPYGTLMYLSLFCAAGASLLPCYEENGWSILFCTVIGYTVHQLASALNGLLSGCALPLPFW